jgi:hypothetical protein
LIGPGPHDTPKVGFLADLSSSAAIAAITAITMARAIMLDGRLPPDRGKFNLVTIIDPGPAA